MLNGSWKLVYTSNSELMALLAANNLPLITIGDITQTIDGATETVTNKVRPPVVHPPPTPLPAARSSLSDCASAPAALQVQVTVPFTTTTVAAQAAVEVSQLRPGHAPCNQDSRPQQLVSFACVYAARPVSS